MDVAEPCTGSRLKVDMAPFEIERLSNSESGINNKERDASQGLRSARKVRLFLGVAQNKFTISLA